MSLYAGPVASAAAVALFLAAGAGAATLHRLSISQASGSGGATAFVQSSASGSALQGEVGSQANASIKIPFGVLGEYDASGSTFGIGVAGVSSTGYAVAAEALGSQPAMLALNAGSGDGLDVYSSSTAPAIFASNATTGGFGISVTTSGLGSDTVLSQSTGDNDYAIHAIDTSPDGGAAVIAYSDEGVGGSFNSNYDHALIATGSSGQPGYPAFSLQSMKPRTDLMSTKVFGTDEFIYTTMRMTFPSKDASGGAMNQNVEASSDLALDGDVYLNGDVFTNCYNGPDDIDATTCTRLSNTVQPTSSGRRLQTYSSRASSPTIEDEGEARLVRGFAHVTIDPAFASTMSTGERYLVFTTGLDDNRGLFVTNRTPSGFDVRECNGGRSTLGFEYRIVARPYGDRSSRLAPIVAPKRAAPVTGDALRAVRFARARDDQGPQRHGAPTTLAVKRRPTN